VKKIVETIAMYFRKGLYNKTHLEMLESKGIITPQERACIEQGE